MLAAASSTAVAGLFAIELRHDSPGVAALSQEMSVASVIADDVIAFFQCATDANCSGLLSDTEVRRAADGPRGEQPVQGLLELSDQD